MYLHFKTVRTEKNAQSKIVNLNIFHEFPHKKFEIQLLLDPKKRN